MHLLLYVSVAICTRATPTYKLCQEFGFDAKVRRDRLALLGLGNADLVWAQTLQQQVIAPHVEHIIERFYETLLSDQEFTRILSRGFDIEHLKRTQTLYLLSLGVGFASPEYFEERLRVGLAHAHVAVPLGLYSSAYCVLQQLILSHIPSAIAAVASDYRSVVGFVLKITALDMSLANDTYHTSKLRAVEGSLQATRRAREELRQQVAIDMLTGATSHMHALSMLQQALHIAQRNDTPLCIIMVDLDRFKEVNDTHGHLVGNEVLRDVTARMQSAVRDFDVVGRYGGEEFLIILETAPLPTARIIAERVRKRVADSPINTSGRQIALTLSQGVAVARQQDDVDSLLKRADAALYAAKAAGRNCVRIAEAEPARLASR